jgi:hypothetical protein
MAVNEKPSNASQGNSVLEGAGKGVKRRYITLNDAAIKNAKPGPCVAPAPSSESVSRRIGCPGSRFLVCPFPVGFPIRRTNAPCCQVRPNALRTPLTCHNSRLDVCTRSPGIPFSQSNHPTSRSGHLDIGTSGASGPPPRAFNSQSAVLRSDR